MIADRGSREYECSGFAIRAEDVHKVYLRGTTRTPVLQGVDLTVRRGTCVYLVGPSGSGKTTLLSILGCILSADRGRVRIFDQEVGSLDERGRIALRRDRIGFVFQRFHLIRGLTTLGNVCVPLVLRGMTQRTAHKRGMDVLEAVGLAGKASAHPGNLSAGECQRAVFARALVGDPELVLADEPTASLDAANGQEVMRLLRHLTTQEGRTAVVVTHDQRILPLADRVFHLENGRIVESEESSLPLAATGGGAPS
jgi:putative ABC transport system ATP-binding protein